VHLGILWRHEIIAIRIGQRCHRLGDFHGAHAQKGVADFAWHQAPAKAKKSLFSMSSSPILSTTSVPLAESKQNSLFSVRSP